MIFYTFNKDNDIVSGRTSRVSSGIWNTGLLYTTQSNFTDDFYSLTSSTSPSPSYGTSVFDVRRTMYYLNVFPDETSYPNDPFFSIAYGNVNGSGSFNTETGSIKANPTKTVYTQYKNILLGTSDLDGKFSMMSGSTTINADSIFVLNFSAYKMKDTLDAGTIQFSLGGTGGKVFTFIDNSPFTTQTQTVYQIISGSIDNLPASPEYKGIGLVYPSNGIIILNADVVMNMLGITNSTGIGTTGPSEYSNQWVYSTGSVKTEYTFNHKTLFESFKLCSNQMSIRKSEYVMSRHYFVRVMNKYFNFSNNPTYVYDGTDGVNTKGTIRNLDFIDNPRTYITSVGLYDDNNNLIAVGKLSRPAVKSFDTELLIRVKLDF